MPIPNTDFRICKDTPNNEPALYWNIDKGWVPLEQASIFTKDILFAPYTLIPVGTVGIMESTDSEDLIWYPYSPHWGTPESIAL